jgi:hypothetical protein
MPSPYFYSPSVARGSELERVLADAGGATAPREWSARLRELLASELERGARELCERRTGYPDPIIVALAGFEDAVVAALPLPLALRADADAVSERGGRLAAAAVEKLVEATSAGPPASLEDMRLRLGDMDGALALCFPAADPLDAAEYAKEALDEALAGIDRLRGRALVLPDHVVETVDDLREPLGRTHPLRVAEAVARLGGSPLDDESVDALEGPLLDLLEPPGSVTRAHADPDPARRLVRRILQRLDGMGKWGGYHTAFDHVARGFAGNERSLAYGVAERLVDSGLLLEKPSVGQRHVSLNPRRSGDIRRLIDEGSLPSGLAND